MNTEPELTPRIHQQDLATAREICAASRSEAEWAGYRVAEDLALRHLRAAYGDLGYVKCAPEHLPAALAICEELGGLNAE